MSRCLQGSNTVLPSHLYMVRRIAGRTATAAAVSASLALLVVVQLHSPAGSRVRLLSASPSTVCAQPLLVAMMQTLSVAMIAGVAQPLSVAMMQASLLFAPASAVLLEMTAPAPFPVTLSSLLPPPPSPSPLSLSIYYDLTIYLSQSSQLLAVASVLNLGDTDDAPLAPLRDQVMQLIIRETGSAVCCHRERQSL